MFIVDQARLVARRAWIERRLFEIVGRWSTEDGDADAVRVFAAEARHHAWRADRWSDLAPVLHDVDPAAHDPSTAALEAVDALASITTTLDRITALATVVLPNIVRAYEADLASGEPVADAPLLRVLQMIVLDAKQDWGAAAQLQRSVVRTEEDSERAAATQSWLEVLLLPCWEV